MKKTEVPLPGPENLIEFHVRNLRQQTGIKHLHLWTHTLIFIIILGAVMKNNQSEAVTQTGIFIRNFLPLHSELLSTQQMQ